MVRTPVPCAAPLSNTPAAGGKGNYFAPRALKRPSKSSTTARALEQLRIQNPRLEGQVLAMRSVPEDARNRIKLYNDILRRPGAYSQDEWTRNMLIEFERMLNPDYSANAPAAPPESGGNI
jgi:hypothetical protein